MTIWRLLRALACLAPLALGVIDVLSWPLVDTVTGLLLLAWAIEYWGPVASTDIAEIAVVLESGAIAACLAGLHVTAEAGFVVVLPLLARRDRLSTVGARSGYIAAGLILFSSWSIARGWVPGLGDWLQAFGVATLAFAVFKSDARPVIVMPTPVPAAFAPQVPVTSSVENIERDSELRETYRALRDAYSDLERTTNLDRTIVSLARWHFDDEQNTAGIARTLKELSHVDGVAVYLVPESREGLVLMACCGSAPAEVRSLAVELNASPILIREGVERALRLHNVGFGDVAAVLLTERGRLTGVAAVFARDLSTLERGRDRVNSVASFLARLMRDDRERQRLHDRLIQAELINQFSHRTASGTPSQTAKVLAADISKELHLSGYSVVDLTEAEPRVTGALGDDVTDVIRLGGIGLSGWLASGANELLIDDARSHAACDGGAALRRGIGSILVQPLVSSGAVVGALVSWSAKGHAFSSVTLGTLRALAPHVLRQVFGGFATTRPGLVDPDTFWHATLGPGSFAEIDLGNDPTGIATRELSDARRKLLAEVMKRLPPGGLITRRTSGTLLAFLPGIGEDEAAGWVRGLGEHSDARWAMKVETRVKGQQSNQFLSEVGA